MTKNNIEKDIVYFDDAVNKFYNKAIKCDVKGIVNDIRFLESLSGRLRESLQLMNDKQKSDFINKNSKYIAAESVIDNCICQKSDSIKTTNKETAIEKIAKEYNIPIEEAKKRAEHFFGGLKPMKEETRKLIKDVTKRKR